MIDLLTGEEWTALGLSLSVALAAATLGLAPAVACGYLLARTKFAGKWLLETLVMLPLVLPPVVTGYLLLVLLSPASPLGRVLAEGFGVRIVFTWWAAVLAAMLVSFPLAVRAARLAFQGVDPRLAWAARSLGAGRLASFFTVALPLARRGVLAGWVLAFARSLGEFGATIMVAGNIPGETQTTALLIYTQANRPGGIHRAWTLVIVCIALACLALAASEFLERRESRREHA